MNQLNVSLQHSISTLAANCWSARKIARELGIHRETVGRYLRTAETVSKPAIVPPGPLEPAGAKPAIVPAGSKAGRSSQCAPLAAVIEQGVLAGLSAQRIYQDLVAGHAFSGSYDAVKRFVRRLGQKASPPAGCCPTTLAKPSMTSCPPTCASSNAATGCATPIICAI